MTVEQKNMPLGMGQLYFNDVRLGSLKSEVVLTYTREFAEAKPGDMLGPVRRAIISEGGVITATICDLKMEQIRMAMGIAESATTSGQLRKREELEMLAVGTMVDLAENYLSGTLVVESLDYKSKYTKGTDYTAPVATSQIARISGSVIDSGQTVRTTYNFSDASATVIKVGGSSAKLESPLKFVHKLPDEKLIQYTFYKASITGEHAITFPESDYATYPISFSLVADPTKPAGQQLFEIVREA